MKKLILLLVLVPIVSFSQEKEIDFDSVERPPIYPGCEPYTQQLRSCLVRKVQTHINKNFRYPEFAQKTDQIIREMNIPANKKITIVEGGAKGADKLGERYARERGYSLVVKPADWSKGGTLKYPEYDKSAGPRRNEEMAEMGDVGIAFPGGCLLYTSPSPRDS